MLNFFEKEKFNAIYFSNIKTWSMWAIIDIHDFLIFFIINIFVIVIIYIFFVFYFQQPYVLNLKNLKNFINWNVENHGHGPFIEFFWTFIPILLLIIMGWPSFHVLYAIEQLIDPFHTIIITGNQWFWNYEYSDVDIISDLIYQMDDVKNFNYLKKSMFMNNSEDLIKIDDNIYLNFNDKNFLQYVSQYFRSNENSKISYDCLVLTEENLPKGYPRLLSTDQVLILPSNVSIRLLITSADVIHSWTLPSLGIKMDAIPGRINQVAFLCPFWGSYWGQCSELCGINHGFMPIEIRILTFSDYLFYLQLNTSFKYENFFPFIQKLFLFYLECLNSKFEFKKYSLNFFEKLNSKKVIFK